MKAISLHVSPQTYQEYKELARSQGKPVAQLIREAMESYLEQRRSAGSIFDIPTHSSGQMKNSWTRAELYEEMLD